MANKKEEAKLPAELEALFAEDSGKGFEEVTSSDLQIPFLRIIQQMSPQINKKEAGFIEGASGGDIFNTVTNKYWDGEEIGLDEDYTLDLLKEAIELAQGKKDISNLLKAVDNLQDMHGMKEKHLLKTTDTIEAFSSVKLIDELKEEEKSLTIQRTQIEEKKEESDE